MPDRAASGAARNAFQRRTEAEFFSKPPPRLDPGHRFAAGPNSDATHSYSRGRICAVGSAAVLDIRPHGAKAESFRFDFFAIGRAGCDVDRVPPPLEFIAAR
jgi:hypothetical protein